jgi:hypothetical protein
MAARMSRSLAVALVALFGFPVAAAPVSVILSRAEDAGPGTTVHDTYVWSSSPDDPTRGASTVVYSAYNDGTKYALLRFDLSEVPAGATVLDAGLRLVASTSSGEPQNVHPVLGPWSELTTTWNQWDAGLFDPTSIEATFTAAGGSQTVPLTGLAAQWVGGRPNYGIVIEQALPISNTWYSSDEPNVARRPALIILYEPPVPDAGVPDAGAPDAGAVDAGVPDAGALDASTPDAGAPGPDAGEPADPETSRRALGIGCTAAPGPLLLLGLLLPGLLRRSSRRR